eukprot:TRINITY_DN50407_c0_g1_i1.p1 TRINITY_DN50407_c0_g1~~TRINITY_DN50407_c0_g1_i1.p1  ORF type:complete len:502 (+),score=111.14 TRINITY_DN50407_c0_g1_i1:120-1625(+)
MGPWHWALAAAALSCDAVTAVQAPSQALGLTGSPDHGVAHAAVGAAALAIDGQGSQLLPASSQLAKPPRPAALLTSKHRQEPTATPSGDAEEAHRTDVSSEEPQLSSLQDFPKEFPTFHTVEAEDILAPVDIGMASCPCLGIEGLTGDVSVTFADKTVSYPAEMGSYCKAWDNTHHPLCKERPWAWWKEEDCMPNGVGGFYDTKDLNNDFEGNMEEHAKAACESAFGEGGCSKKACGECNGRAYHGRAEDEPCGNGTTMWSFASLQADMGCGWGSCAEVLIGSQHLGWEPSCEPQQFVPQRVLPASKHVAGNCPANTHSTTEPPPTTPEALTYEEKLVMQEVEAARKLLADSEANVLSNPRLSAKLNLSGAAAKELFEREASTADTWCPSRWCYVDPCECKLEGAALPARSMYLPDARFRNIPLYYSYHTCGSTDRRTHVSSRGDCMPLKEQDACAAKEDCRWIGTACLPTHLSELCDHKQLAALLAPAEYPLPHPELKMD